jgi:hypothetical protein
MQWLYQRQKENILQVGDKIDEHGKFLGKASNGKAQAYGRCVLSLDFATQIEKMGITWTELWRR